MTEVVALNVWGARTEVVALSVWGARTEVVALSVIGFLTVSGGFRAFLVIFIVS